ncbi:MAG: tetratricopeptide repeat protein [Atopobiaceae bacterium]|jgi:tetratricopeptide (TPR) repeat protein|nr:tetratricopeptide repeat protein [Atopobiaceae bacterium]MCH4180541.1 tetratricopeptide repeat protein [Atopobiaceae bacterium]MCH4214266.1 tetratricopeptide repeat protein [Atopobiaceae bacterium]MCH4229437.1 tetratricopeptide repeat protein [Atopobiaceae bacterium]MCH4276091.1 tetratricopeptide repeat protein [Atopobiaceae bacterium]
MDDAEKNDMPAGTEQHPAADGEASPCGVSPHRHALHLACSALLCVLLSAALLLVDAAVGAPTSVGLFLMLVGCPLAVWALATALARRIGKPVGPHADTGLPVPPSSTLAATQAARHADAAAPAAPTSPAAPEPAAGAQTQGLAPRQTQQPAAPATSRFDLDALSSQLLDSADPIADLKLVVGDIRTREAHASGLTAHPEVPELAPCGLESYLARTLEEAGLFSKDVDLPAIDVVRPHRSGLFYLRIEEESFPYLAKVRVVSIEAALNATLFAALCVDDPAHASIEECYEVAARIESSVTAQLPPEDSPIGRPPEVNQLGEWSVRQALAVGVESFRLPYRLATDFRLNVAERRAAFEVDVTPAEAFPTSVWSGELGRVIPTTSTMRRQLASDYALRVGILVAAHAFRCSERVDTVHVAGILDNGSTHRCYYSVCFDRRRFRRIDLGDLADPQAAYASFDATVDLVGGVLTPIVQGFSLDDERFCPARRYESVDLSDRRLTGMPAEVLHADRVSDLAIHEEARREHMADAIARNLSESTEKNVRMILDLTQGDPDPTVAYAARRTVTGLIDGTLDEHDALDVEREFVSGDELSHAIERASDLLEAHDASTASRLLADALDPIDSFGLYEDDGTTTWRYFSSYVSRALYNKLLAKEGEQVNLVPDAYLEAHLLLSSACILQEDAQGALEHAERAMQVAPLDARGYLRAARAHENLEQWDEATHVLMDMLRLAHDPESLGVGYYRLAFMEWHAGNILAAGACYRKSLGFSSSCRAMAAMELRTLEVSTGSGPAQVTDDTTETDKVLVAHEIPLAPTREVSDALVTCAEAATDAEVFPVARNFATLLGALTGDDVMVDIMRSIETEPDR